MSVEQQDFWRKKRKAPPPSERNIHCAVVDVLRRAGRPDWVWMHVANGELRQPETARLLQRMGVLPGAFDLLLISPTGVHHWLELKRDAGAPLSIAQLRFKRHLRERNVPHAVCYGFDEAVLQLHAWDVLPIKIV